MKILTSKVSSKVSSPYSSCKVFANLHIFIMNSCDSITIIRFQYKNVVNIDIVITTTHLYASVHDK